MDPVTQTENGESEGGEPENSFENAEKLEEFNAKTLKNALLAKKRLQAFCAQKQYASPLTASSVNNKSKTSLTIDEMFSEKCKSPDILKKPLKKSDNPMDKAKAVVEEIELLKKVELLQNTPLTSEERLSSLSARRSRSRSKSSERALVFRKRDRKPRNYRRSDPGRRSQSPVITKAKDKSAERKIKYPKNWEDFNRDKWTFDKITKQVYNSGRKTSTSNDIFKQLLFETPAEIIKPFYYKNEKGEEVTIPYQFIRFTQARPQIAFSVNSKHLKDQNLSRSQVLKRTPKKFKVILERFLSKNTRIKFKTAEPIGQRNWYHKNWKDNDSKLHETSIGLSFLQTYSDDGDEEDELFQDSGKIEELKKIKVKKQSEIIDLKKFTSFDNMKKQIEATCFELDGGDIPEKDEEIRTPELNINIDFAKKRVDEVIPDVKRKEEKFEGTKKEERSFRKREREKRSLEAKMKENRHSKTKDVEDEVVRKKEKWEYIPLRMENEEKIRKKIEKTSKRQEDLEHIAEKVDDEAKTPENTKDTSRNSSKTDKKLTADLPIPKIEEFGTVSGILSETFNKEETSWTPERIIPDPEEFILENITKADKTTEEVPKKTEKKYHELQERQKSREIHSQDEWDETPNNSDSEHVETRNSKKRKKKNVNNDSDTSTSSDASNTKKKKRKEGKKKKLKDHDEKAKRKKEKLKLQKLKLKEKKRKRRKERDREKKILKKLKKQIEHNLELVDLEEKGKTHKVEEKAITQIPIVVKTEKEDDYENVVRPPGDLRNLLDEKMGKIKGVQEQGCQDIEIHTDKKQHEKIKKEQLIPNNPIESSIDLKIIQLAPPEINLEKTSDIVTNVGKSNDASIGTKTPDTDEYHSNWESDDGNLPPKKIDRSWGSDEEMFDRSFAKKTATDVPFGDSQMFEIPLNIKTFSRRNLDKKPLKNTRRSRTRSPERFDIDNEIKLLEKERKHLSEERLQLEIEKLRLQELEMKNSLIEIGFVEDVNKFSSWNKEDLDTLKDKKGKRWDLREDHVDSSTSKEMKQIIEDQSGPGLETKEIQEKSKKISNSPEITSTKSPIPNVLENAYEEFMKAVSAADEESKEPMIISSTESEALEPPLEPKNIVEEVNEDSKLEESLILSTTDPKVLQDILLPGEVPMVEAIIPAPVPVPSPKVEILPSLTLLPPPPPPVEVETVTIIPEQIPEENLTQKQEDEEQIEDYESKKSFSFSTLVLPSKKTLLLDKSKWKVDEDSDEESTMRRMYEEMTGNVGTPPIIEDVTCDKKEEREKEKTPSKRKRSPAETPKDKRKKEDDVKQRKDDDRRRDDRRRDDDKRRGKRSGSPVRHEKTSPRRRRAASPPHRRSPSRYNRSPPRRRRAASRSPQRRRRSYSPAAARPTARRRSPSPRHSYHHHHHSRRSKSPGHSPMDGLKRSVADSTISDDLLPQPYMESSNSPLNSANRRARLTLSPKRPSLDERINQVLGIESTSWKGMEVGQDYGHEHEMMYTGYHQETPVPCGTSKVLQVGNILQVVPTEEPLPPAPVQPPPTAKIVQVGNMLQIVPTDMEVTLPPPAPHYASNSSIPHESYVMPPTAAAYMTQAPPPPSVEKQSADAALMARNAERLAAKAEKRREKEERKAEKERKRKERDKRRKMRLKVSTEEMIKRALELEGFLDNGKEEVGVVVPEIISETPGLDPSKSILSTSTSRIPLDSNKTDRRKSVQFADGVRPGEGTSPSGGEELSSPPPETGDTTKIKKHKKLDVAKKKKRKIKVKVIKRRQPSPDSDSEYENLPPPSPPPGSPPPHVFPPRVKVHAINNVPQHYLPTYGVTTAPQQQSVMNQPPHLLGYQTTTPPPVYRPPPHYGRTHHHQPYGTF